MKTLKFQIFLITAMFLTVLVTFSERSINNALHMLISLLFCAIFIYWSRNRLLKPIMKLTDITKKIAGGDFAVEIDFPVENSEIGQLTKSFKDMAGNLNRTRVSWNDLIDSEERLRKSTIELTRSNAQLQAEMAERQNAEKRMSHMAFHDSLTGLPNRYLFHDRLKMCLADVDRYKKKAAVLLIGIDDIKRINDTLGHNKGDLLLKGVADNLERCVRSADSVAQHEIYDTEGSTVARLGGDEFMILLANLNENQDVIKVANRLMKAVSLPFQLDGNEVFITISIGIAICPDNGRDADQIMKNADIAFFHAKKQGKNNFMFFKEYMNEVIHKRLLIENDLRKAIKRKEMLLYYQPRIDVRTGNIISAEALARWNKSGTGLVSPAEFIPVAEETGLIVPIGEWILRTACKQHKTWQELGLPARSISVNISVKQFQQKDFIKTVSNVLKETSLDPEYLELEITENILMQNAGKTILLLKELRKMGIKLAMDDFGTGYSSFNYLIQFPLDVIKIDMSFIRDITERPDHAAIVKAIITMAHSLNLTVVAEGVEKERQLEMLRDFGCDEIQGYLFSPPLPAIEYAEYSEQTMHRTIKDVSVNAEQVRYCPEEKTNPDIL